MAKWAFIIPTKTLVGCMNNEGLEELMSNNLAVNYSVLVLGII